MNQRIVHNAPVIEFATLIVLTHYALIPVDTLDGEEYSATTNGLSAQPPDYISARRTSLSKTGQGIEDARGLIPHRIFTTIQVIGAKYKVADIGSLRICNPSEYEGEVKLRTLTKIYDTDPATTSLNPDEHGGIPGLLGHRPRIRTVIQHWTYELIEHAKNRVQQFALDNAPRRQLKDGENYPPSEWNESDHTEGIIEYTKSRLLLTTLGQFGYIVGNKTAASVWRCQGGLSQEGVIVYTADYNLGFDCQAHEIAPLIYEHNNDEHEATVHTAHDEWSQITAISDDEWYYEEGKRLYLNYPSLSIGATAKHFVNKINSSRKEARRKEEDRKEIERKECITREYYVEQSDGSHKRLNYELLPVPEQQELDQVEHDREEHDHQIHQLQALHTENAPARGKQPLALQQKERASRSSSATIDYIEKELDNSPVKASHEGALPRDVHGGNFCPACITEDAVQIVEQCERCQHQEERPASTAKKPRRKLEQGASTY